MTVSIELLDSLGGESLQSWSFENELLIRVGRSRECEVRIDSDKVSRNHLELHYRDGDQWVLSSLGRNGCYISGRRMDETRLESGTVIHLGRSGPKLRFRQTDNDESADNYATIVDPMQTFSELRLDAEAVAEHSDQLAEEFGLDDLRKRAEQLRKNRQS